MLTHAKKVCNPFWGSVISRKSIDIYRYALTGWGEEWGTIGVIWPCVNGIVYAMSVRKGGWSLENGVSSTSLRNPWVLRISRSEDPYDASCVLPSARVCPHVLSRAAVFPSLAPSWPCPVGSSQAHPAPPPPAPPRSPHDCPACRLASTPSPIVEPAPV